MPARADRRQALALALAALWEETPGRLAFALRLVLVCCITALIALWFEIPEPALTVYLVLFVNKPQRMATLALSLVMLVFVSLLIALLLPLAAVLVDVPFWRVAALAILPFGIVFLGSASRLRPIAGTMALVTAYVLDLLGSVPAGELAARGLLYAWLFVAVPAGVSIVAALLVAPDPAREAGALIGRALRGAVVLLEGGAGESATLREAIALDVPGLLKLAAMEHSIAHTDASALRSAATAILQILAAAEWLQREALATDRAAIADAFTPALREMADVLEAGGYPIEIETPDWPALHGSESAAVATALSEALVSFTSYPLPPLSASTAPRPGFFEPEAFTSPAHLHHALKVTLAAMTCYLLYSLWDWPGIHTAMITCFIVALPTAAETIEKLSLRIAGCLVGAGLGLAALVFVLPGVTSIGGLLLILAGGMGLACWIAAGPARISYAGFQIGFAFLLCILQGSAPEFDLAVARDRVIGVLLGTAISYLVFTRLWPVSVTSLIESTAARLAGLLQQASGEKAGVRVQTLSEAAAVRADLARWLELAAYEPNCLSAAADWIERQHVLLAELDRRDAPLRLARPLERV